MILSRLKTYLAILGAFLAGLAAFYFKGKRDGRDELEYEHTDKRIDDLLEAKKVQDDVDIQDDDWVANRAKSRWVRKSNSGE